VGAGGTQNALMWVGTCFPPKKLARSPHQYAGALHTGPPMGWGSAGSCSGDNLRNTHHLLRPWIPQLSPLPPKVLADTDSGGKEALFAGPT